MEIFHAFLTVECGDCREKLIRIAQSEYHDLAICPVCFSAGPYEDVVEDGAGLAADYNFPAAFRERLRQLREARQ